jgi:N-acyl homoserine lactone hydrolase
MSEVRVHILKIAEEQAPRPLVYFLEEGEPLRVDIYAFLLQTEGRNIVFDLGIVDPTVVKERYGFTTWQEPGWQLAERLREHDVDPWDVDTLVVSHLHWDHFNENVDLLPNARIYVQRREVVAACAPTLPHALTGYDRVHIAKLMSTELFHRIAWVDGDEQLMPGIRAITLPGHAAGQQGVLVQTGVGPVLLTGDGTFTYRNLDQEIPHGYCLNVNEVIDSYRKIRSLGAGVVPSHDPLVLTERYPSGVIR